MESAVELKAGAGEVEDVQKRLQARISGSSWTRTLLFACAHIHSKEGRSTARRSDVSIHFSVHRMDYDVEIRLVNDILKFGEFAGCCQRGGQSGCWRSFDPARRDHEQRPRQVRYRQEPQSPSRPKTCLFETSTFRNILGLNCFLNALFDSSCRSSW